MPIFEYACHACGKQFDQLVRTESEEKQVVCPHCGGRKLEKLLSVPAAPRGAAPGQSLPRMPGACGRCGDPNGPCAA